MYREAVPDKLIDFRMLMRATQKLFLLLAILCQSMSLIPSAVAASADHYFVYIGTYTNEKSTSKGIYAYRFDKATGDLTATGLVAEIPSPTYLALHPNGKFLYAVNEISNFEGQRAGSVSSYSIDLSTGKLTHINTVSSKGGGPCHLAIDHTGKALFIANYGGGSVASYPIKADGSLGEAASFFQHKGTGADPKRQTGPHAHSVNISPDNRFVAATDLGLDQVLVYKLDAATATLTPNDPPFAKTQPGEGPRHLAFSPNGKFAYVVNELKPTMGVFAYDKAKGALQEIQNAPLLPKEHTDISYAAEVRVDPKGKFVYGSNRRADSLTIFSIGKDGKVTAVDRVPTQGKNPRDFNLDPTGSFLIAANQDSDNLVIFRVDKKTGKLTPTGKTYEVGKPVAILFVPAK